MTSPKHPADAYTIAIDPQAKHKGTLRIVKRFFMAETVAVVTVHFDYLGKTYSETIRVADLDFPEAPEPAPEPAPASILDTPASFKPGTVVALRSTGSTATVLHPLGDGKRKVRVELYNGEVAYFRPHQLQRDWSAPTIKAEHVGRVMGARVGDGPPILVPMHETPQPPVLDAKALRSRAILYNLLEVAAAKQGRGAFDYHGAVSGRLDPLRNVVAPVEPERIPDDAALARRLHFVEPEWTPPQSPKPR